MDLHNNIFYGYRGPDTVGADRDRQLENNLTKALVNTLSLGGEAVWRPFLGALGLTDAASAKFLLQRRDLPSGSAVKKRYRMLLAISKKESSWVPDMGAGTAETYESVPDAWVYGDKYAVLVESKVNDGDFSQEQMQAHFARLRSIELMPPEITRRTWGQIHGFFGSLLPLLTDASPEGLLVRQFMQFLEYSGMSEFTGFRPDHFHYFLLHEDEDARLWIREQMKYFAIRVQASLQEFSEFYETYDVGNLKGDDSYCWVAFGPGGEAYRRMTHQTLSLSADGLRVYVNTELKSATDRLKSVLRQSGAAFRAALQHLHAFEPFELILEERVQRQASLYDYTPKMRLHSSLLVEAAGDVAWDAFAQTAQLLLLPYLRIERLVRPPTLMGDPVNAIQRVVRILQHNDVVVKLLNE
jgi:hypothetical protein